ncbi:MAG: type IX secretion system membrane protein PorP/SprF [Bacteroidia bacterium]
MMRLFLIFFFIVCLNALGQDPTNTAFYYNRLELNPSYAGGDGDGKLRTSLVNRNSFQPFRGPHNFSTFSIDYGFCGLPNTNLGIGLIANNEIQGDGFLKINKLDFVLGITQKLSRSLNGSVGFRMGYIFQNVDWNEFIFSDQLDPIRGIVRPSSNQNANLDFSTVNNWSAGGRLNGWASKKRIWSVGFAVFNIAEPRIGLLNRYPIYRRISLHGGMLFKSNPNYIDNSIMILARFDKQSNFSTSDFFSEYFINKNVSLGFGVRRVLFNNKVFNANMLYPSIYFGFQPNGNFKIFALYENNIFGNSVIGKTNNFEVGLIFAPRQKACGLRDLKHIIFGMGPEKVPYLSCPTFFNSELIQTF